MEEAVRRLEELRLPQFAGLAVADHLLVQEDGEPTPEGWGLLTTTVSAIYCLVTYKLMRPVTWALFPAYRGLPLADKRNWDSRYSSNIHAAICVVTAYYLLWKSDYYWRQDNPVPQFLRNDKYSYMSLGVSVGYFLVDMFTCLKYHMGGMEMVLHHIGSLTSVVAALLSGEMHMLTMWMLFTEFTTPLINNRWWMEKMEMKSNILYTINGLGIMFSWIFARLAVFPPFFYLVFKNWDTVNFVNPLSRFLVVVTPSILFVLNTYWFTRIVRGVYRVLSGKSGKPKTA